jgi:hypothetical protein
MVEQQKFVRFRHLGVRAGVERLTALKNHVENAYFPERKYLLLTRVSVGDLILSFVALIGILISNKVT